MKFFACGEKSETFLFAGGGGGGGGKILVCLWGESEILHLWGKK